MIMTPELRMAIGELVGGKAAVDLARRISATQPRSERWERLVRAKDTMPGEPSTEIWENARYEVTVRRHNTGWPLADLGSGRPWVQIGISAKDGTPRHDWREFQLIKNQICGPEWEAIELYPAESRLLDPSNYYILWCAQCIPIGLNDGRVVVGPDKAVAPQRGWK